MNSLQIWVSGFSADMDPSTVYNKLRCEVKSLHLDYGLELGLRAQTEDSN